MGGIYHNGYYFCGRVVVAIIVLVDDNVLGLNREREKRVQSG